MMFELRNPFRPKEASSNGNGEAPEFHAPDPDIKYDRPNADVEDTPVPSPLGHAIEKGMSGDAQEQAASEQLADSDINSDLYEAEQYLAEQYRLWQEAVENNGYHRRFKDFLDREKTEAEQQANFKLYEEKRAEQIAAKREEYEREVAKGYAGTWEEFDAMYQPVNLGESHKDSTFG